MQTGIIALLGLASLFIGWILTLVLPGIRYFAWGILLFGVLLIAVAFVIDYRRVRGALVSRRGKFSTGTTVMVSIFVGIIILANAISFANYHRWDVTGLSQYTLTSQTKDVLEGMETPVESILFSIPGDMAGDYLEDLLNEYKNYTDELSFKRVDPDQHPDQARQYGAVQYPAAVFVGETGQRLILPQEMIFVSQEGATTIEAEHAFTSAIAEVTGAIQKKIYFLTGHGENNVFSTASEGYSTAREGLLDNLYKIETLDIRASGEIPDDCTILVIAGPEAPLTSREVDIISSYLDNNGWALIMVNPNPPDEIRQIIAKWGMDIGDGFVVDNASYAEPNTENPLIPPDRSYFAQFGMFRDTYFPGVTALIPQEETPEYVVASLPLIWTSTDSWQETGTLAGDDHQYNEEEDFQGPLAVGVLTIGLSSESAEADTEEAPEGTRLMVYGDSDFASNRRFQDGDNGNLFLSSVEMLGVGKELITMDRKYLQTRRLLIGPEVERFITISSIGLLPLLVLVAGAYIWWRRR